jgi:lipoate---protein ligase
MKLRLIDSSPAGGGASAGLRGALNMGIDESVAKGLAEGSSGPTLRFYRWSPPCVSIGYFEDIEGNVDLEAAKKAGVDVLRRVTAGGSVFHNAELTYSIVLPLGTPLAPLDILESYSRICSGLVAGLARLGVDARFAPVNDIEAGGKKLSGNAQTRKRGILLQHGTILLGLDLPLMFSLLRVPDEKLRRKLIAKAEDRINCLEYLLGREVSFGETAAAMKAGFAEAFGAYGVEIEEGGLSQEELTAAEALAAEKYSSRAWNFKNRA